MTTHTPAPPVAPYRRASMTVAMPAVAVAFGAVVALASFSAAGPTLGMYFGALIGTGLVVPALVAAERSLVRRLLVTLAATVGAGVVLLAFGGRGGATSGEILDVTLIVLAYAVAVGGIVAASDRLVRNPVAAGAIGVVLGLAWLTWPVWLSPATRGNAGGRVVAALVRVHPPLVANGVLTNESPWTEQPIAYGLTNLNQDTPLALPSSAGACVMMHGFLGAGLLVVGHWRKNKRAAETRRARRQPRRGLLRWGWGKGRTEI